VRKILAVAIINATIKTLGISWEIQQPTTLRCGDDLIPNTAAFLLLS